MNFIYDIFQNQCLLSVMISWLLAQIIKVFTGYFREETFSLGKFFSGTGGMPSSHSATVVSLFVSSVMVYGSNYCDYSGSSKQATAASLTTYIQYAWTRK